MNVITNTLLIFIFIFVSLIIGVPGMDSDNIIKNKVFLLGGLFTFQLLLISTYKLRYKCKNIEIKEIINKSINVAILGIIGYSLHIDLLNMSSTRDIIIPYLQSQNSQAFVISSIISIFILGSLVINMIITGSRDECITVV